MKVDLPKPGSDLDPRLYATVSGGSRKLHVLKDDGSGYFDAGTLCGVIRNLGDAQDFPDAEFADRYHVCPACLALEAAPADTAQGGCAGCRTAEKLYGLGALCYRHEEEL